MSYILPFISSRQIGGNRRKLNCNFLLNRFICEPENTFSVSGTFGGVPPFACQFRKDRCSGDNQLLAVASEEGDIILLNCDDHSKKIVSQSWTAHNNAIFDICWLPDSPKIISSSGDHSAILWDAITHNKLCTFSSHTGSIKCIDVCPEQSCIFATGARDGTVKVWDTRVQRQLNCDLLMKPEITITSYMENKSNARTSSKRKFKSTSPTSVSRSVTSVAFQDENHLASADCDETTIKIWDLRRTYCQKLKVKPNPKYTLRYKSVSKSSQGSITMTFDSTRKNLYVCCTDNNIYSLDCHSYSTNFMPVFYGFKAQTFFVKMALSYDDQYLLCGSSDEKAYLWNVLQPGPPLASLKGHAAEVTAVAWHPRKLTTLATCGDDNAVFIWKAFREIQIPNKEKFAGFASPISDMKKLPENSDVENTDRADLSPVPANESRSLKERSLVHFFSYLNSCTPPNGYNSPNTETQAAKFKPLQEEQKYSENILKEKTPTCNKESELLPAETASSSLNNVNLCNIHGKENLVNGNTKLFQSEVKHQTNAKKKKFCKFPSTPKNSAKLRLPVRNTSGTKKPKPRSFQGNLITWYFQEPSPSQNN